MYLRAEAFDELGDGTPDGASLKARNFTADEGGEATKKAAQIIDDTSDGRLLYDADGKGEDEARRFATRVGGAEDRLRGFRADLTPPSKSGG